MGDLAPPPQSAWTGLPQGLLRMRRLLLVGASIPVVLVVAAVGAVVSPVGVLVCLVPLGASLALWRLLGRNWRSWRYVLRDDDLLISHGVLLRRDTIVPYGRMQLVEVTSGPLLRHFGLARLQLHTAAAATDASIPGLHPDEATALRDQLAALGEARSAGL